MIIHRRRCEGLWRIACAHMWYTLERLVVIEARSSVQCQLGGATLLAPAAEAPAPAAGGDGIPAAVPLTARRACMDCWCLARCKSSLGQAGREGVEEWVGGWIVVDSGGDGGGGGCGWRWRARRRPAHFSWYLLKTRAT